MAEDMNKRVEQFLQVRDALKRIDDEYAEKRRPLLELQELLQGRIQDFLDTNKLDNLKTSSGTCYKSTRYTASLADPDIFMRFVIEHQKYELLDRRANATAVRDFVETNKALPPGCKLNAIQSVGVRRASGS